jgi:iron(II)-dependent oxidoreductase
MINRLVYKIYILLFFAISGTVYSQDLQNIGLSTSDGLTLRRLILSDSNQIDLDNPQSLFSFELNGRYRQSDNVNASLTGTRFVLNYEESLRVTFTSFGGNHPGWRGEIVFENEGFDTIVISNVLPFGENPNNVYITGKGGEGLARARLHRPGKESVGVILPDNAWEAGYSSFNIEGDLSACALIRRGSGDGTLKSRYITKLPPGSKITFSFHGEIFRGKWQEGLRKVFRDRYLYDLYDFDNSLYEREDLKWIRESYLIVLQFAWDKSFYDRFEGKYMYGEYLAEANRQFGHLDVFGIWPGWPRLGVDERNQWDLYKDMPGGTDQIRSFARLSRQYDTRFFIAYNPWDRSTRHENPLVGMAELIKNVEADGVILDTRGNSSYGLQKLVDSIRQGVVMYSEGMAVVKDMPGIVSGRVHNAIYLSPELNLNRLIKPDFSIFRVCDVGEAPLHREIAVSFFNGYGTELNLFRPGRDFQLQKDYDFLASTTMILRENSDVFRDPSWTPLIDTRVNNVLVNRWGSGDKILYTVLTLDPSGIEEPVFEVDNSIGHHYVSLWNNTEHKPVKRGNKLIIEARTEPFRESERGTRLEGSVDCIARFAKILDTGVTEDTLSIYTKREGSIRIYKESPAYSSEKTEFYLLSDTTIYLPDLVGTYQGKLVIQLIVEDLLKDVNFVRRAGGLPWLISRTYKTELTQKVPRDMVLVPGTTFSYRAEARDNFIPYPENSRNNVELDSFLIDRYPVSNLDYHRFVMAAVYYPRDTVNYLSHWIDGKYRQGQEKYPVVNVSIEDARAYAEWAGKRLPTEDEWQLAAQGTDGRLWPWGDEFHGTKCNNSFNRSTPVDAFPKGESPYGVFDLVGNIWQITGDIYSNGTHYFNTIRGGSFFKPTSSWWYVEGGPQPLSNTQILLLVSPGFDRSATVGFRCVKDFGE